MPTSQELRELREEQILEAATLVFARLGFHKARMDDIVEEAGLSKGAVYWYFDSKDEIITTILNRFFERSFENFQLISQGEGSIQERFMTMFRSLANEIDEIADLMPIIYEFYAVAAREQAIRKTIQKYFQSYTTLLEELIKVGIERGELRRVSPNEVALSLIALMEGCMLVWTLEAFDHHKPDLEKLFVSTMDLLLAGLKLEG